MVLAITSASFATRTDGVRPLRGASCSIPASRSAANRFRQVPTVRRVHPRSAAISSFRRPTAAARTILALKHQSRRRTPPARPFRQRRSFFRRHCDDLRNPHGMILRGWSIRRQNPQIRFRILETLHQPACLKRRLVVAGFSRRNAYVRSRRDRSARLNFESSLTGCGLGLGLGGG